MIEIAKHQIIKSNDTQRSIEQLKIYDFCNERAKNESIQKFAIFFLTKSLTKSCFEGNHFHNGGGTRKKVEK